MVDATARARRNGYEPADPGSGRWRVLEASARLRIVHQLAFELAVSNYFYGSSGLVYTWS